MTSAISLSGLTKVFGDFTAVDGVGLAVEKGEIFGLLGPNGSGKTTCLKMICGLLPPTRGEAEVLGYDVRRQGTEIRAHLGYMPQQFSLYDDLTVRENLQFSAGLFGLKRAAAKERAAELEAQFDLAGFSDRSVGALSAGWKRRLGLAAALVHRPELLLLDEPTSGVDPAVRRQFWELLHALADGGTTILITTHHLDEAEFCHRVAIMRRGRILACDTPAALRRVVPDELWEIRTPDWAGVYHDLPGSFRRYLQGKNIRVWLEQGQSAEALRGALPKEAALARITPGLEDVFLYLARG